MVCTNCGTHGKPRTHTKGSLVIEIMAWLLFLVPGLLYSLWRLSSRYRGCPSCGAPNMIPEDSPRAMALKPLSITPRTCPTPWGPA
jgi:hypothetical protein